jgi:hypothetical protein
MNVQLGSKSSPKEGSITSSNFINWILCCLLALSLTYIMASWKPPWMLRPSISYFHALCIKNFMYRPKNKAPQTTYLGRNNCIHTLTPSIMDWRTPWLSMFASNIELVTHTCMDFIDVWIPSLSLRFPSQMWNIFGPWNDGEKVWIVYMIQNFHLLLSNEDPNYLSFPSWHRQCIHQSPQKNIKNYNSRW